MALGTTGRMLARGRRSLAAIAAATIIVAVGVADSAAATSCDRVASASGSDSAAGTAASPFRTAGKLVGCCNRPDRVPAGRPV